MKVTLRMWAMCLNQVIMPLASNKIRKSLAVVSDTISIATPPEGDGGKSFAASSAVVWLPWTRSEPSLLRLALMLKTVRLRTSSGHDEPEASPQPHAGGEHAAGKSEYPF